MSLYTLEKRPVWWDTQFEIMQTCVHTNKVNHYRYSIYMDALFVLTEASSFSKQNIAWIKTLETKKQQKQN